jgi:hypothetical protein
MFAVCGCGRLVRALHWRLRAASPGLSSAANLLDGEFLMTDPIRGLLGALAT